MKQKNLKLTSVRLNPDTLERIEKFIGRHEYWTKNAVINNIITTVMERFDDRDIYDMVRTTSWDKSPITAIYKINEVPKVNEI